MCRFLRLGGIIRPDAVKVQLVEEGDFFGRREQRIAHELVECLEALHVYPHGSHETVFSLIESISSLPAQASQEAHASLEFQLLFLLSVPLSFFAVLDPVSCRPPTMSDMPAQPVAVDVCQLPPSIVFHVTDEVKWVLLA